MDVFFNNVERENEELHVSLENTNQVIQDLQNEKELLKSELYKQKTFHRNYVDEVSATEALLLSKVLNILKVVQTGRAEHYQWIIYNQLNIFNEIDNGMVMDGIKDSGGKNNVYLQSASV